MHSDVLNYLFCPSCREESLTLNSFQANGDDVQEGIITCKACSSWWRIEGGILDLLLPVLRNKVRHKAFALKYGLDYSAGQGNTATNDEHTDSAKRQIDFFAVDAKYYERDVTCSPYFTALDEVVFGAWIKKNIPVGGTVLEVGAGTGRQSVRMAQHGARVLAFDISEEMLHVAKKIAFAEGLEKQIDFVIADAGELPCRQQSFDTAIAVGTLHHVPEPVKVIGGIGRSLKKGGAVFTYDPHNSPVRFIFDTMMRWWKLYDEEASDDPLISKEELNEWMNTASIDGHTWLSTYLPPHCFYLLPAGFNRYLLRATDFVFVCIPYLRNCGGMIVFEGRKNDDHKVAPV